MVVRGRTKRTVANNLAHVRTALEGVQRRPFADKLSNHALGIAGASRAGTKRPMIPEEFEPYRRAVAAIDAGVAIALDLQLELGCVPKRVSAVWDRYMAGSGRCATLQPMDP